MELNKFQNVVNAVNSYYGFAIIIYAVALFLTGHGHLFWWAFIILTPILCAWGGYLLKPVVDRRVQRYGFRLLSDVMSYEISPNHKYTLRYTTKIKAEMDRLFVYPLSHQWTGSGEDEAAPVLSGSNQYLMGLVKDDHLKDHPQSIEPYELTLGSSGDWQFWFVAFNPPLHKGNTAEIKYSQVFHDPDGSAKPCLYYIVRTASMKSLELNVKFPKNSAPKNVTASYTKPSNSTKFYKIKNFRYDHEKQWAILQIDNPKKGCCYRIDW
jgi:hypothetical protein